MSESELGKAGRRDDLVERIELMEAMIAEGQRATIRFGWVFVLWGLVDLVGMAWQQARPNTQWAWPVSIGAGLVLQFGGTKLRKPGVSCSNNVQGRSVGAVWSMMGAAMILYVGAALMAHLTWQWSYIAGCYMMIGLAHAASAMILRWRAQGVTAAVWWMGGVGSFVARTDRTVVAIFLAEMVVGMIAFGVYAMLRERREERAGNYAG